MIPQSPSDIPEVLEVQVIPSEEVDMVPDSPPATNVLFPKVTPQRLFVIPFIDNLVDVKVNTLLPE